MKLLLVEADPYVSSWFKKVLDTAGFEVDVAGPGADVALTHYPVVMLGPHVGAAARASLIQSFHERAGGTMPLLWIAPPNGNGESALSRDYLFEALQIEALAARFQALAKLKRGDLAALLRVGNVTVDSAQRQVVIGRKATFFPPAEVMVLAMLMQREGKIVPKQLIETRLYGTMGEKANAAEVCIHRLRKRLAATDANVRIHTIRGLGYFVGE
jgi:two-component system response regulator TctD